jgi:hypothetical protein
MNQSKRKTFVDVCIVTSACLLLGILSRILCVQCPELGLNDTWLMASTWQMPVAFGLLGLSVCLLVLAGMSGVRLLVAWLDEQDEIERSA